MQNITNFDRAVHKYAYAIILYYLCKMRNKCIILLQQREYIAFSPGFQLNPELCAQSSLCS